MKKLLKLSKSEFDEIKSTIKKPWVTLIKGEKIVFYSGKKEKMDSKIEKLLSYNPLLLFPFTKNEIDIVNNIRPMSMLNSQFDEELGLFSSYQNRTRMRYQLSDLINTKSVYVEFKIIGEESSVPYQYIFGINDKDGSHTWIGAARCVSNSKLHITFTYESGIFDTQVDYTIKLNTTYRLAMTFYNNCTIIYVNGTKIQIDYVLSYRQYPFYDMYAGGSWRQTTDYLRNTDGYVKNLAIYTTRISPENMKILTES